MSQRSEAALRRWALGLFGLTTALVVAAILLADGLSVFLTEDQRPPLDTGLAVSGSAVMVVGLLLVWGRPRNPLGWLLQLTALLGALCQVGQSYGSRALFLPEEGLPLGAEVLAVSAPLWIPALLLPATAVLLRYPSGSVTGRWGRRLDRAVWTGLLLVWVGYAGSSVSVTDAVPDAAHPLLLSSPPAGVLFALGAVLAMGGAVGVAVHTVVRLMRARTPERQQLAWLLTAAGAAVLIVFLVPAEEAGTVAYAGIPAAVAVGVLRYNLLGIEVVVRRTLLYGGLTVLVLVVFVAVTAALTAVLPRGRTPEVVAASLVAVGLVPVRERLQRLVDRLVYGDRADPWTALQRLGTPVGGAADGTLLDGVAAALSRSLRVPGVCVLRPDGSPAARVGEGGEGGDATGGGGLRVPLLLGGAAVGTLAIAPRPGEPSLSAGDRRLVDSVAPLVAVVLHAVDLAAALEAERARVVDAAQHERGRLRRELHDGLGPSLTGVGLGLEALESRTGPTDLTHRLRAEVASAIDEVRRILDDLRPGALDELGLIGALRRRAEQLSASGVQMTVEGPSGPLELAPGVEVAAYRIADEALANVVRHAHATTCAVRVELNGSLVVAVVDDGTGIPAQRMGGVGLPSMQARAEQLGGRFQAEQTGRGTAVTVELPTGAPA